MKEGFFPYINIPTLKIFAVRSIISQIVNIRITDAITTSSKGIGAIDDRKMIMVGVKRGIIVRTVESVELGSFNIIMARKIGKINDIEITEMNC